MSAQVEKPKVYAWFVAYCVLMCVMYLLVFVVGLFYPTITAYSTKIHADTTDGLANGTVGLMYTFLGLIFFIAYAIAPFLKPKPGAWIYDLVLICIGMTSCCCIPMTVPLLIFWIKPDTKSYFGR